MGENDRSEYKPDQPLPEGRQAAPAGGNRAKDTGPKNAAQGSSPAKHPSKSLPARARGFGIGGGYERPYRKEKPKSGDSDNLYGPMPHAGYYGTGGETKPFKKGQAGFAEELNWYRTQYGENTSGYEKRKR